MQVRGSYSYLDEFGHAIELFRQRKITVEGMISNVIPLEKVPQAFQDLTTADSEIKVLVQPAWPSVTVPIQVLCSCLRSEWVMTAEI